MGDRSDWGGRKRTKGEWQKRKSYCNRLYEKAKALPAKDPTTAAAVGEVPIVAAYRRCSLSRRISLAISHRLYRTSTRAPKHKKPHLGCSSDLGGGCGGRRRGHVNRAELLFVERRLEALGQVCLVPLDVQTSLGELGFQLGNLCGFIMETTAQHVSWLY